MTKQAGPGGFQVDFDQPLIGIPIEENGHQVVLYFTDEKAADAGLAKRRKHKDGRHLAGVWKDLNWEQAADELDRIRHESSPTPPIDLNL